MSAAPDARLAHIELLVLDVDGVLTDGKLLYGGTGELGKSFNVKDGFGMRRLMEHGVTIAVISARQSAGALHRCTELGVSHVYLGCKNKDKKIQEIKKSLRIEQHQIAVVGDDVPDAKMMREGGLAIGVADAADEIIAIADWVTTRRGGEGAVREVCDAIVKAKTASP